MITLTVAPLATPKSMTRACESAVQTAKKLFLQTSEHPCADFIVERGLDFVSMDDLYESCYDFDELNAAIAKRLTSVDTDAVYAVPGRGAGNALMCAIRDASKTRGISVDVLPSPGYAESALACIGLDAFDSRAICSANSLFEHIDTSTPLIIEEIDTVMRAGDVKLALSEFYPDTHNVFFCTMDNRGTYTAKCIPLFELDRQQGYHATTVLTVPPAQLLALDRHSIDGLIDVMHTLRAPGGCPWDAEQTHKTLRSSLIEEAYEVLDAIDRDDEDALCEELGDVLLQIVFHACIEEEKSAFTMRDVTTGIVKKLIYRHPHVFSDAHVNSSSDVLVNWEQLKKKEKHFKSQYEVMRAVPAGFPALMRSQKIQKKAADVGFDWDCFSGALQKVHEEADEVARAVEAGESRERVSEEIGDLLFSAVNTARLLKCDSELSLNAANEKFISRFGIMEAMIRDSGLSMSDMTLDEMDKYWDAAKLKK